MNHSGIDWEKLARLLEAPDAQELASLTEEEKAVYPQLLSDWKAARGLGDSLRQAMPAPHVGKAKQLLKQRMQETPARQEAPARKLLLWPWLSAAAVLLLFVSIYFIGNGPAPTRWIATTGNQEISLPDGSKIQLMEGEISLLPHFGESTRSLQLRGKAQFQVASDPSRPFEVHTENASASVLGTIFTLQSGDTARLDVSEGRVAFAGKGQPSRIVLGAGQKALHYAQTLEQQGKGFVRLDYSAKRIIFDAPLSEIASFVSNWENKKIEVTPQSLADKAIATTQSLPYDGATALMKIVSISANASVTEQGDKIILSY